MPLFMRLFVGPIEREHVLTEDEYFVVCMWALLDIVLAELVLLFRDPLLGIALFAMALWLGIPAARIR